MEVFPQQLLFDNRPVAGQGRWRSRFQPAFTRFHPAFNGDGQPTGALLLGDPAIEGVDPVGAGFGRVLAGRWEGLGAEPGPQVGGGAAEGLLEGLSVLGPEADKPLPALGPERFQLGGQGLVGPELRRQGIELQGRIAIQPVEDADQLLEAQAPLLKSA